MLVIQDLAVIARFCPVLLFDDDNFYLDLHRLDCKKFTKSLPISDHS